MRPIDADELLIALPSPEMYVTKKIIEEAPTIEAEPIKHGYWVQVDETKCRCTNCDVIALIGLYPHGDKRYCPNCGAKMDLKDGESE